MLGVCHDHAGKTGTCYGVIHTAVLLYGTRNLREAPETCDIRCGYGEVVVNRVVCNDNRTFTGTETFFHTGFFVQLVIRVVFTEVLEGAYCNVRIQCGCRTVFVIIGTAVLIEHGCENLLVCQHTEFHLVLGKYGHGYFYFVPCGRYFQADFL